MEKTESKKSDKLRWYQRIIGGLKKTSDIWNLVFIFTAWRLTLEFFAWLGKTQFAELSPGSPWNEDITAMINNWTRWDSGWYLSIIQHGYVWVEPSEGASNVAFFPLYPYLIKLLAFPLESNPLAVATAISSLALLVGIIYFFKLVRLDHTREISYQAVLFLLLFPMSFFFVSAYTESLFFLLTVACLYHARQAEWLTSSIFGFFAAFTRFVGVMLIFVIFVEYLQQVEWKFRKIRADIGFSFLIPLGLFSYMYLLEAQLGSSLLFFRAQESWGRAMEWPNRMLTESYFPFLQNINSYFEADQLRYVFEFAYFTIAIMLLVLGFIFLRKSYALFALFAFIPAISSGTLESIGRYILVIFPFFILFAIAGKWKPFQFGYIALSAGLLAYNVFLFVNWNWVS
ncbi:mannosyltransferase family protein [Patescibacteria group bacterium]